MTTEAIKVTITYTTRRGYIFHDPSKVARGTRKSIIHEIRRNLCLTMSDAKNVVVKTEAVELEDE